MSAQNSRSFFRIDVMLPCSYHIISEEDSIENALPISPDATYIEKYFMQDLQGLDEQITEIIEQINLKSNLLAKALTAMNSKINFVLQTIDQKQLTRTIPHRMVNISAGGLAFKVEGPVSETDKVDVLIQPLSEEPPVLARCNIVKIIPESDGTFTVALEYQGLNEDDRRKLVYFIQTKEIEAANQQRNAATKKA